MANEPDKHLGTLFISLYVTVTRNDFLRDTRMPASSKSLTNKILKSVAVCSGGRLPGRRTSFYRIIYHGKILEFFKIKFLNFDLLLSRQIMIVKKT